MDWDILGKYSLFLIPLAMCFALTVAVRRLPDKSKDSDVKH